MGLPLRRDPVQLARAFLLDAGMADLVQVGERRIDHAGTGAVEAAGTILDGLDQFIAVSGTLAEQRENEKLQILGAELASPSKITAAGAAHKAVTAHGEHPLGSQVFN